MKTDWYLQIEEPVRELVRLLRDNGFNTISSCGHWIPNPTIEMEWYGTEGEIETLYNLLWDNGLSKFELHAFWPSSGIGRSIKIEILET